MSSQISYLSFEPSLVFGQVENSFSFISSDVLIAALDRSVAFNPKDEYKSFKKSLTSLNKLSKNHIKFESISFIICTNSLQDQIKITNNFLNTHRSHCNNVLVSSFGLVNDLTSHLNFENTTTLINWEYSNVVFVLSAKWHYLHGGDDSKSEANLPDELNQSLSQTAKSLCQHLTHSLINQGRLEKSKKRSYEADSKNPYKTKSARSAESSLVYQIAKQALINKNKRDEYIAHKLFSDPVWDILLVLFVSHGEAEDISVTNLCQRTDLPMASALRWIGQMTKLDMLHRVPDPRDSRRVFIKLMPHTLDSLKHYFLNTAEI